MDVNRWLERALYYCAGVKQNPASLKSTCRGVKNSCLGLGIVLLGCTAPEPESTPASGVTNCIDGQTGYFRGELYGDLKLQLDWPDRETHCEGMPRAGKSGIRLRFARNSFDTGANLTIILGISGAAPMETAEGLVTTLTIIDEQHSRIYSNAGKEVCWSDIETQAALANPTDYSVKGRVYCTSALPAVGTGGWVNPGELEFSGRMSWPTTKEEESS